MREQLAYEMFFYQCEGDNFNIAKVSFAYKNCRVLTKLKERGQILIDTKPKEQLAKVDKALDELMLDPEIYQPVSAFVTFESHKTQATVLKFMKSKKSIFGFRSPNMRHKLFGVSPIIKKAPEPSNIIWEHYSVSKKTVRRRTCKVYMLALVIYLAFFAFSIWVHTFHSKHCLTF